jgi:malonyl-CoA/methylmalonyl-CoA synthetase
MGELLVKSEGVFKEYYNRPEATKKEFTNDGWFKTGDMCAYSLDKGKFKILGRKSSDIIKSGGYKISAISVETVLLGHPDIKECVVVGLEDQKWGQKVAAIVILREGKSVTVDSLKKWAADKLPQYSFAHCIRNSRRNSKKCYG